MDSWHEKLSAKEELLISLRYRGTGIWIARPEDDADVDRILNQHAHELAEKQRAKVGEWGAGNMVDMWRVDHLIDLIDPEVP